MSSSRFRAFLLIPCLISVLLLGVSHARAQIEPGIGFGFGYYDASSNAVIHGVVETVEQNAYSCHWGATEVTLKTGEVTYVVQVGPTRFLTENNFSLAKGDDLRVRGFKFTCQGTTFLVAHDVTKGGKTPTVRDALGVPAWTQGKRGGSATEGWGSIRGRLCCGCRCLCWWPQG